MDSGDVIVCWAHIITEALNANEGLKMLFMLIGSDDTQKSLCTVC